MCDWTGRGPSRVLPLGVGAGFQVSKTVAAEQVTAKDACSSRVPFPPLYLLISYTLHLSNSFSEMLSDPHHHCTQNTACDCVCGVSAVGQNHSRFMPFSWESRTPLVSKY